MEQCVDFEHDVFGFAEDEGVDEGGERFGDERAGASGEDDRVVFGAVEAADGDAGEVEHLEDVGVGEFVGEGEAEGVEVAQAAAVFEREERLAVGAEAVGHVGPGGVAALGEGVGRVVEDVVEDGESAVGLADVVEVGVDQGPADGAFVPVALDHVPLAADVAGGFGDAAQEWVDVNGRHDGFTLSEGRGR